MQEEGPETGPKDGPPAGGGSRLPPPVLVIEGAGMSALVVGCSRRGVPVLLPFAAVTGPVLERLRPPAVAFDLFGLEADASEVLARLSELNYRGRVFALTPPLPRPAMVQGELRAQFPRLRFRLVAVPQMQRPGGMPPADKGKG